MTKEGGGDICALFFEVLPYLPGLTNAGSARWKASGPVKVGVGGSPLARGRHRLSKAPEGNQASQLALVVAVVARGKRLVSVEVFLERR